MELTDNSQIQKNTVKNEFPIITILFILTCILIFGYQIITQHPIYFFNFYKNNEAIINNKEYYRLLTCTLLHVDILHIACNMYFLWGYGKITENFLGHQKQLLLFLFSGLLGSLGSFAFVSADSIGASGICFGVLGSLLALKYSMAESSKQYIQKSVIQLVVLNLIIGFSSKQIDMAAHIFGFIGGYFITIFLGAKNYPHPKKIFGLTMYIIIFLILFFIGNGFII